MPKFLIIRFSSIGDIVLTTPVVRCLKLQVPGAEVHYLTKKGFAPIVQTNPYIDRVHLLGHDWDACMQELKNERFDHVIDLHHNLRTLRVKRALGVPARSFRKLNFEKWMLTALKINRLPNLHIVDRNLETVTPFGVVNDGAGLDYFIPESERLSPDQLPAIHRSGFVGLVIGAALATKQLPPDKLGELCRAIPYPIILLGGPEDKANGDLLAQEDPEKIWNACGRFSLHGSAHLVQMARLVVTHDTGLMHIAAAFGKPVISIWGNTIPAFGMSAYFGAGRDVPGSGATDDRFEVDALRCRPCSKIGYKKCPKGHFRCMRDQDIGAIAAAVVQRWQPTG